jgi:hypothetical protein
MRSSTAHAHLVTSVPRKSSAISRENLSSSSQPNIPFGSESAAPGSFDDASAIRGILVRSIDESGKGRAAIADEMSRLLARRVSEKMLNAFTAESRDDRRWPLEFTRAFCAATGSDELLRHLVELTGCYVITAEEKLMFDLGRQLIIRGEAEEQIEILKRSMHGRAR